MRILSSVAAFWYDFIVGDDWTIAVAVVAALAIIALLANRGFTAWWFLPVVVLVFLGASLWRVAGQE